MCRRDLMLALVALISLSAIALPGAAQEQSPPIFATNTPMPSPVIITTPAVAQDRYALRLWQAEDMQAVLRTRVDQLGPGLSELQKVVQITQYEFARRFPGGARDGAEHERLLRAMLAAPPGSVDMRGVVRPALEVLINQRAQAGSPMSFGRGGFQIDMIAANINGVPPQDAVFHVRYPGTGVPLVYEDFIPAVIDASGYYHLLVAPDLPAAPSGGALSLVLMGIDDFNGDGLDELALSLSTGGINNEMRIFGWRGDQLANVVQPGQKLLFGEFIEGLDSSHTISVEAYRLESPAWGCLSEIDVTWRWEANFFRPVPSATGYVLQSTANCRFFESEPLFALPVPEALAAIYEILPLVTDVNDPAAQRALMIEVVLRAMDGDVGTALAQALELETQAEPGSWLAAQTSAFVTALGVQGVQSLEICAALVTASKDGACDVDAVLARTFDSFPLRRNLPLDVQLDALGITVLDQTTLTQVGRVERQAVRFDLAGERWWAFAPLDPEFYTAEKIDPLPGYEVVAAPLPVITASQRLYDALLLDDDPATALAVLDNLRRENPQASIAPDARFLQALSLDLLGERVRARQSYYDLWSQNPLSIWGQLAADHLEQR
jgi:hypothetical protein